MLAASDLRTRRLPNRLIFLLAGSGFVYLILSAGERGAISGLGGIAVGFACWIPFYALGWLGAGDVKMYAAAAVWLGPMGALEGALIGALAGAVLSLMWMIRSRGFKESVQTLGMAAGTPELLEPGHSSKARSTIPYGVALAIGAICAIWAPGLLLG